MITTIALSLSHLYRFRSTIFGSPAPSALTVASVFLFVGALPLPAYDESSALDGHGHHHHHHHHHQRGATVEYRGRRAAIKNEDGSFWNSGKMSYHCPICNAGYTYKKTLKTHMKYDCGKEPRFKCPYCSKRDKCSSNIYKHIRMRHDGMPVIVHRN